MRYRMVFPSLTLKTSVSDLPNPLHPIPMAFNNNISSGNLHAPPSKQCTFLEVVLANEQGDSNTLASRRGVVRRTGHMVSSPMSLRAEPSFGKYRHCSFNDHHHIHKSAGSVSSATSHTALALGHKYLLYPRSYEPTASWQPATNQVLSFSSLVSPGPRDPLNGKHACSATFL
jgi:hypothetical protein